MRRAVLIAVVVVLAISVSAVGASVRQYQPKPHTPCRTHYVKRLETVKEHKHGKFVKVKETFCVYVAPVVVPQTTIPPSTTTTTTTSTTTTTTSSQAIAVPTPAPASPPALSATTTTETVQLMGCVPGGPHMWSEGYQGGIVGPSDKCSYAVTASVMDQNGAVVGGVVTFDLCTPTSGLSCSFVEYWLAGAGFCSPTPGTVTAYYEGDATDAASNSAPSELVDSLCTS